MNTEEIKKIVKEFKDYLENDPLSTENEEIYDAVMEIVERCEQSPTQENLQDLYVAISLHEELDRETADVYNIASLLMLKDSEDSNDLSKKLVSMYQTFVDKLKSLFSQTETAAAQSVQPINQTTTTVSPQTNSAEDEIQKIQSQLAALAGK